MADAGDLDLGQLTTSQQEALQQYTDVTSQEIKDAVPLLERSQWNVQVRTVFSPPLPPPVSLVVPSSLPHLPIAYARCTRNHGTKLCPSR